ncbi:hypothetical protein MMMB2_4987 [Mycobacterium marinum MB2]|nr:hypothetical protein MMMB2_4987 [Mycobacterium marinum MB2]
MHVRGVYGLAQHVGEPEQPLEPARPLAETEAASQRAYLSTRAVTNHGKSVMHFGCRCQRRATRRPCFTNNVQNVTLSRELTAR